MKNNNILKEGRRVLINKKMYRRTKRYTTIRSWQQKKYETDQD
jgi:hypothetical protein